LRCILGIVGKPFEVGRVFNGGDGVDFVIFRSKVWEKLRFE
jgi:hypothetical protein